MAAENGGWCPPLQSADPTSDAHLTEGVLCGAAHGGAYPSILGSVLSASDIRLKPWVLCIYPVQSAADTFF